MTNTTQPKTLPYTCTMKMYNLYLIIIFITQIQLNCSQLLIGPDPIQQFKQIQQKISSSIFSINNHYSQLTRNLQDSIQNVINHSSITKSINKLETNINSLGQSPCSISSDTALYSLTTSSKEDVNICANTAVSALTNNITLEAERFITKFVSVQGDITDRVANCFKMNLANQVGLALCLVAQINPVELDVASLMQEIEKTYALSEAVAQEIIFSLSNCILNVENNVDKLASNIVTNFRSCIIN